MKPFLPIASMLLLAAACGGASFQERTTDPDADAGEGTGSGGSTGAAGGAGGSGATGGTGGGMGDAGASGGVDPGTRDAGSTTVCTSQTRWTNGDRGSATMHPGGACITCHATNRSAPKYVVSGTIYPTAHEPIDCNGVNGTSTVTVVITDATGTQLSPIPVNNVGNFYYAGTIASPFHVKVVSGGRENAMTDAPATGDCNSCHTQDGANSAPGRILAP